MPTLSAASALNTPLGVRSYGMGMAQTGNANDLSALYFNPAALGNINYFEYGLSYHDAPANVGGHSLLLSIPLSAKFGTLGLSGVFNRPQDNQYIREGVNALPDRNKYSYIAGLSYGVSVLPRLLAGGFTVKWFGADFSTPVPNPSYPLQQRGVFIDLALLSSFDPGHYYEWLHWLPRMSFGIAARNLQPLFRLPNEVPRSENRQEFNTGISMHFPYKFMLNLDSVNSPSATTRWRGGLEYWPVHFLALRGGVTVGSAGDRFQSIHWGFGIGETVQSSKLSFEYAAAKEFPDGFGANFERPHVTYHRFAFHHSFESIEINAKGRVTPLRFTERYTHRYRFAHELAPREIVADTVASLSEEDPGYEVALQSSEASGADSPAIAAPEKEETPPRPKGPKRPTDIVGKHIVAIFPVSFEVVAGQVSNVALKEKIRGNFLITVNRGGVGRLISPNKLKAAPKQGERETESAYLNRLQQALGADLIVFSKLYANGLNGDLRLVVLYYRRGDSGFSAQDEIEGVDARESQFVAEATEKFNTTHKSLLEELN
ncbi:MAG: hypothetical protein N2Z22_10295 [Turneriella sp.]|nr:hypothetical protein [Turneriella sp.]